MSRKVLIISTSLRGGSFSESLAHSFEDGAKAAGHDVTFISLKGKNIGYCRGCCSCQDTGKCAIKDDANGIVEAIRASDVVVWATPVYYYGMSGQMKTLIDRSNPLYVSDYAVRDVYLICTAADGDPSAIEGTLEGLRGWVRCLDRTRIAGTFIAGELPIDKSLSGTTYPGSLFDMGKKL